MEAMSIERTIASAAMTLLTILTTASAQDSKDRAIDQYQCRDVMRDSGANRDVAIAFLHGFVLGKSGRAQFNLGDLHEQTDAFIERCLSNPSDLAITVMTAVKNGN
jgi:hypothetical protein